MYSFRLVKQNINAQLHYNLNWPQTDCAKDPDGEIRANEVVKCNELTRIVAWFPELKMHLSLLCRIPPGKWCNIGSVQNNLSTSGEKTIHYPPRRRSMYHRTASVTGRRWRVHDMMGGKFPLTQKYVTCFFPPDVLSIELCQEGITNVPHLPM